MKTLSTYLVILFFFFLESCGQQTINSHDNYTKFENDVDQCLDSWLSSKGVEMSELRGIFEDYYSEGKISNSKDPLYKQYNDILKFWERPTKQFPIFSDKKRVLDIQDKLDLSTEDIIYKTQLRCFYTTYRENKIHVDTTTSFYLFGSIADDVNVIGDLSPSLIAGTVNMFIDEKDLKKEIYQNAIVLMFCFDMAVYFSDHKE